MIEIILFFTLLIVFGVAFGWTDEIGQLRKSYASNNELIKGKKQVVFYKYKNKHIWLAWNYYYVHITEKAIHLVPPVLFRYFMPKLIIERNNDETSEYKKLVRLKRRTVFESNNCSVLLAFDDVC